MSIMGITHILFLYGIDENGMVLSRHQWFIENVIIVSQNVRLITQIYIYCIKYIYIASNIYILHQIYIYCIKYIYMCLYN